MQTWSLLEDPGNAHLIAWTPSGDAFIVLQPEAFAKELLPTVFKHNNYTSFVRQLNIYVRSLAAILRQCTIDICCQNMLQRMRGNLGVDVLQLPHMTPAVSHWRFLQDSA
jgi:hypothetical protein